MEEKMRRKADVFLSPGNIFGTNPEPRHNQLRLSEARQKSKSSPRIGAVFLALPQTTAYKSIFESEKIPADEGVDPLFLI